MACYSPIKGYMNSEGGLCFDRQLDSQGESLGSAEMEVPCGGCVGCRLDHSGMWASRITHEASLFEHGHGNTFITLTYDDVNLPSDWSLDKSHFQLFMKRLRKHFNREKGNGIRFYHCGEYGDKCKHGYVEFCDFCHLGRPHYHAILFNVSFADSVVIGTSKNSDYELFTSETLERIWGKGLVQVGTVTSESAGYCARYCMKKITGVLRDEHYRNIDEVTGEVTSVHQEYATMSRNPGLGKEWLVKFYRDVYPSDEVPNLGGGGVIHGAPRYYDSIMEKIDEKMLIEVKKKRIQYRDAHAGEYDSLRLMAKGTVKMAQIRNLKREL